VGGSRSAGRKAPPPRPHRTTSSSTDPRDHGASAEQQSLTDRPGDSGGSGWCWIEGSRRAALPSHLLCGCRGTPHQKSAMTKEGTGFSLSILAGSEPLKWWLPCRSQLARLCQSGSRRRSTDRRAPLLPRVPTPVAGAGVVSTSTYSSFDVPLYRPSARETHETERTRWSCCRAAKVERGADGEVPPVDAHWDARGSAGRTPGGGTTGCVALTCFLGRDITSKQVKHRKVFV
jgi:hypothetical protein